MSSSSISTRTRHVREPQYPCNRPGAQYLAGTISGATIWSVIEAHTAVLSGCLVVIRPVFVKVMPRGVFQRLRSLTSRVKYKRSRSRSNRNNEDFARLKSSAPAIQTIRHPTTIDLERGEESEFPGGPGMPDGFGASRNAGKSISRG